MGWLSNMFSNKPVETKSTSSLPQWMTSAGQGLWQQAQGAQAPFEAWSGSNPYGGTSDDTRAALEGIRGQVGSMTSGAGNDFLTSLMNRPAQQVSTEGTFDTADISKYMNPYVENAMQPALRKITEAFDATRNRLKSQATAAGSFGDARHGIVESAANRDEGQAIGDTASQFLMSAFRDAVAAKQGDIGRKLQADTTNANFANQDTATKAGIFGQQQNSISGLLQQLLSGGQAQDARGSLAGNFDFNEFLRGQNWDMSQIGMLASILNGLPVDRTQTQTQSGGAGPGWGLAGGALAGLLGGMKI